MNMDGNGHIHIYDNESQNAGDHDTYFGNYIYWTNFKIVGDPNIPEKYVFVVNGSANLVDNVDPQVYATFVGNGPNWKHAWLHIHLSLPNTYYYHPMNKTWNHESMTPFVTINGVEKGGDNHYGGWQLFNFGVDYNPDILVQGGHDPEQHNIYAIWAHFGLKGDLFRLDRVGFTLTVTGSVTVH
jgi:hypothetical protein